MNHSELVNNSRKLRKNMTAAERKLWYTFLKHLPVRFRRQKIVDNYILDFYCHKKQLAIELDGEQHYNTQSAVEYDRTRDEYLGRLGIKVLRYSNYDIDLNFDLVCNDILAHIR